MQATIKKSFFRAARGKVIIGFLFACMALLLAWAISKFAFKKMLHTVSEISAPNDRLRVVNQLSQRISRLDQLQREQAITQRYRSTDFARESKRLNMSLDTLLRLYANDQQQVKRLKSIKKLLADRDKQLAMYLQVRETLVNTKSFSSEVDKLNNLIDQQNKHTDSALATETSTSTTTIAPDEEKKSRGFLSKLFGKKKAEVYKIISEEFKVTKDTLSKAAKDSMITDIRTTLQSIENEQKEKTTKFLKREAVLANASFLITKQMLNVLREVETEAVAQLDHNSAQAKQVVNKGISQITAILVGFLLLTIILVYLILTDISKLNRYRKALEITKDEAEYHSKAKQRFLSNMSHEIRTPLQSIIGYAELISQQQQPDKRQVDAIYQSSVHLLQIVNEILDYNRIISGEFTLQAAVFDVNKLLDEVLDVMRPLAEQKSIKLIHDIHLDDIQFIEGDAFRLKQILFNVLSNAIKFTIEGEILMALTVKRKGDDVHFHFTIKDTGIGFDEESAQRIFNEFEQIETKDKYLYNKTGTGLGLAIVKSLVENQGGRINVKSKRDIGTTFTIHLKYLVAQVPIDDVSTNQFLGGTSTGKVWVVDDDRLILDLCALIFEKNHIGFKSFDTANAVLKEPLDQGVRYVMLDMRLPEMSGLELHRVLKKKMGNNVKFYAITAQVLPDERAAILAHGFEGLIMKPFRAIDLLSVFKNNEPLQHASRFDTSTLEKMTLGDQQLLEKILNRFNQDCEEDGRLLKQALKNQDLATCRLIVHRLAGRTAQMGAATIAAQLRRVELEMANTSVLDETLRVKIDTLLGELSSLVTLIAAVDYSMP